MIFVESLILFVIIAIFWLLVTMLVFRKLNKTRTKGVVLIILAFIGVGAVFFAVGHFLEWHETSEFCADLCHSMEQHDVYIIRLQGLEAFFNGSFHFKDNFFGCVRRIQSFRLLDLQFGLDNHLFTHIF